MKNSKVIIILGLLMSSLGGAIARADCQKGWADCAMDWLSNDDHSPLVITMEGASSIPGTTLVLMLGGVEKQEVIVRAAPAAGEYLADPSAVPEDLKAAMTLLLVQKGSEVGPEKAIAMVNSGEISLDSLAEEIVTATE